MKSKFLFAALLTLTVFFHYAFTAKFDTKYTRFEIKPSRTDTSIKNADEPHLVLYNPKTTQGKLMVYLPGTGGIAAKGPEDYFNTVVEQGYRLISLSYNDEPSAAEVCNGRSLVEDSNCAEKFHWRRIYGEGPFDKIKDQPQDAIIPRLVKLLKYLTEKDKKGNWEYYFNNGKLRWGDIAFSGQSQGGGMAEFIAKHESVYKIISFSGGWDWSLDGRIANWYSSKNKTPPDVWFGTYNVKETNGGVLLKQYKATGIPNGHIYAFDLPVGKGTTPHTDGIRNLAYRPQWIEMLGRGN